MSYYIVLEGMDGVGKTTVSKVLSGVLLSEHPDIEVFQVREPNSPEVRSKIKSGDVKWSWTYAGMYDHLEVMYGKVLPSLTQRNMIVIQDRDYRISQLVYRLSKGGSVDQLAISNPDVLIQPRIDLLVHLTCSKEARKSRASFRDRSDSDINDKLDDEQKDHLNSCYHGVMRSPYMAKFCSTILEIDTTDMSVTKIVEELYDFILCDAIRDMKNPIKYLKTELTYG